MARYSRHLLLEGWDQGIINEAKVLIVGIGALGCEIAKNLALVGVRHLILVDMDTIEISNLSRQILFEEEDQGRLKAEVAARKLKKLNPRLEVEHYPTKFQEVPLEVFKRIDVIAGGLDSFKARFDLNKLAHNLRIPYVDGAATGFKGNVQVIIPDGWKQISKSTPCLKCYFPVPPADEKIYAACTIPGQPRSREQCIIKAEDEYVKVHGAPEKLTPTILHEISNIATRLSVESPYTGDTTFRMEEVDNILNNKIPSILTVMAVISGIVSHEVLKIIHRQKGRDIGSILDPPYLEYNSVYGLFTPFKLEKDRNCIVCGKKRTVVSVKIPRSATFEDLFHELKKFDIFIPEFTLITRAIDGTIVITPQGKPPWNIKLQDTSIQNHDILRATYDIKGKNDKLERKQVEFLIELEGG